jgi:hypothetical protein
MPFNPHTYEKVHSNLAWLLQTTEVKIMRQVWQALKENGILFLSVHDEVLVQQVDAGKAEQLFRKVLSREFPYFKLNSKGNTSNTSAEFRIFPQESAEPLPAEVQNETRLTEVLLATGEQEKEICFDWKEYYLNGALNDYRRHYGNIKNNKPDKWIQLWVNDINKLLRKKGIDSGEFIEKWLSVKLKNHASNGKSLNLN